MPAQSTHRISARMPAPGRAERGRSLKRSASPAALIPLPRLEGIALYLPYAKTGISNSMLSRIGLWICEAVRCQEIPGPWPAESDPGRIQAELAGWIQTMLSEIASSVLGESGHLLTLEKLRKMSDGNGLFVSLQHPIQVDVLFCDFLPELGRECRELEAVVIAALQTLCWVHPAYTYDDVVEQGQDWLEEELLNIEPGSDGEEDLKKRLAWLREGIPKEYRRLLRREGKPTFPPFSAVPPESSWSHPWWRWAKGVYEVSQCWEKPIPYYSPWDYLDDLLPPEYLTPILWSSSDPATDFFSDMMECKYQNFSQCISVFPVNRGPEVKESLQAMKMFGEWYRFFIAASRITRGSGP